MEHSSGSLRFKISLSKQEMEHEEPENSSKDPPYKTSYPLYVVLSEIHRLCVKRDHKGIFAQPVTEDIAPNYFSFIAKPMDLGTMYTKLSSRNYYSTARQYLDDLRLMCRNAMCYNPPDTIYYQKARKMLAFAEKQMSSQGLRKLSTCLLKNCRPLTVEEIDLSGSEANTPHQYHRRRGNHHHRYPRETLQHEPCVTMPPCSVGSSSTPKVQETVHEKVEDLEDDADASASRSVERPDDFGAPDSLTPSPSSSYQKRRFSNASLSSVSAKVPRYANSPPLLIPEVEENFAVRTDSPLSTCGRSDAATIDMETTEGDQVDYSLAFSPASSSTLSSSAQRRPCRSVPNRRFSSSKKVAPNPRHSVTSKSRRNRGDSRPTMCPVPNRIYAEDAWTFTDSLTDRTSPDRVIAQVKQAAQLARAKFLDRYGQPGRQTVVYLDTSETGKIYAKYCEGDNSSAVAKWVEDRKLVNYPLAMRQLLTPKVHSSGTSGYHGLIEQMTSQQVATLHALSKIRYDPSEPIAMGIYGPLAIFQKEELAQLIDAYGGSNDAMVMESVLSLLKFVEPIGVKARRWAHLRLAEATDGFHARMLVSFADPQSPYYNVNWMKRANLTIDASVVDEFKANFAEESTEKTESAPTMSVPTSANGFQVLKEESTFGNSANGGQMSIAKLPSNTSTTSTTVKQMATVQAIQQSGAPNLAQVASTRIETAPTEQEGEEPYDLLTEALNAAIVKPSERNQLVFTGGSNSLATTVNELAQISALTAAINPIQQPCMAPTANKIQSSAVNPASNLLAEPTFTEAISSKIPFHEEKTSVVEGPSEPENIRLVTPEEPLQPKVTPKMDIAEASAKVMGSYSTAISGKLRRCNVGVDEDPRLLSEISEPRLDSGEPFSDSKEPINIPGTALDSTEVVQSYIESSHAVTQLDIEKIVENSEKVHPFNIVIGNHVIQSQSKNEKAEKASIQLGIEDPSLLLGMSRPPIDPEELSVSDKTPTAEVVQDYFGSSVSETTFNMEKRVTHTSYDMEVAELLKNQHHIGAVEKPMEETSLIKETEVNPNSNLSASTDVSVIISETREELSKDPSGEFSTMVEYRQVSADVPRYLSIASDMDLVVGEKLSKGPVKEYLEISDIELRSNPNLHILVNAPMGSTISNAISDVFPVGANDKIPALPIKTSLVRINIPLSSPGDPKNVLKDPDVTPTKAYEGLHEEPMEESSTAVGTESEPIAEVQGPNSIPVPTDVSEERSEIIWDNSDVQAVLEPELLPGMGASPSRGSNVDPTKKMILSTLTESQLEETHVRTKVASVKDSPEAPRASPIGELHRLIDTTNVSQSDVESLRLPLEEAPITTKTPPGNPLVLDANSLSNFETSTFDTSSSPVLEEAEEYPIEAFNLTQANLDENAQSSYPHSNNPDDIPSDNGGRLVDYGYTDSSASGSINRSVVEEAAPETQDTSRGHLAH